MFRLPRNRPRNPHATHPTLSTDWFHMGIYWFSYVLSAETGQCLGYLKQISRERPRFANDIAIKNEPGPRSFCCLYISLMFDGHLPVCTSSALLVDSAVQNHMYTTPWYPIVTTPFVEQWGTWFVNPSGCRYIHHKLNHIGSYWLQTNLIQLTSGGPTIFCHTIPAICSSQLPYSPLHFFCLHLQLPIDGVTETHQRQQRQGEGRGGDTYHLAPHLAQSEGLLLASLAWTTRPIPHRRTSSHLFLPATALWIWNGMCTPKLPSNNGRAQRIGKMMINN